MNILIHCVIMMPIWTRWKGLTPFGPGELSAWKLMWIVKGERHTVFGHSFIDQATFVLIHVPPLQGWTWLIVDGNNKYWYHHYNRIWSTKPFHPFAGDFHAESLIAEVISTTELLLVSEAGTSTSWKMSGRTALKIMAKRMVVWWIGFCAS